MTVPRVSVVVPAHSAAAFVCRSVGSDVLAPTWADRELLVVDDGGNDGTLDVLAGYCEHLRVLTQANAGAAATRKRGSREARRRYVAFRDADDWWLPAKLERQVALLDGQPDIGFCSAAIRVVMQDGAPAGRLALRCHRQFDAGDAVRVAGSRAMFPGSRENARRVDIDLQIHCQGRRMDVKVGHGVSVPPGALIVLGLLEINE